jgi:hypothetical protein
LGYADEAKFVAHRLLAERSDFSVAFAEQYTQIRDRKYLDIYLDGLSKTELPM